MLQSPLYKNAVNALGPHKGAWRSAKKRLEAVLSAEKNKVKNGSGSAPDPADQAASYPSGPGGAPHPVAGSRAGVTAQAPPPQPS